MRVNVDDDDTDTDTDTDAFRRNSTTTTTMTWSEASERAVARASFVAVGVGTVFPWNVFITEREYFARKFIDERATRGHEGVFANFEGAFAMAYAMANVFANALGARARTSDGRRDEGARAGVATPLVLVGCAIGTSAMMTYANASAWLVYAHTMAVIVVVGAASAVAQGNGFALASDLPPAYAQAVMSGQAASGVAVSIVAIITTAGANGASDAQARAYFFIAACVLFACAGATWWLDSIPFYRKHAEAAREALAALESMRETSGLLEIDGEDDGELETSAAGEAAFTAVDFGECQKYRASVAVTFVVTLSVFPAVTSAIRSEHGVFGALWSPSLFLLFNVGDLFGRLLATAYPKSPPRGDVLLKLAALRLVFLPIIAACDVSISHWMIPSVFKSECWSLAFIAALAVTNGWLASVAMMHGPSRAPAALRASEAFDLSFALVLGIFLGSVLSFLFVALCTL